MNNIYFPIFPLHQLLVHNEGAHVSLQVEVISRKTREHKAFIMWPVAGVHNLFILHKLPRTFQLHLNKAKCQRSPYSEHELQLQGSWGQRSQEGLPDQTLRALFDLQSCE